MVGTPSLEWVLTLTGSRREDVDALLAASVPGSGARRSAAVRSGWRASTVRRSRRQGSACREWLESKPADVVRAVCEGIAYAVRHCLESAGLTGGAQVSLSGGGVRSVEWRRILADILQRPLRWRGNRKSAPVERPWRR